MLEEYEGAEAIERAWCEGLTPDPLLSVSEWADQHRMLSSKANAQWDRNTDATQQRLKQRPVPNEAIQAVRETVGESPLPSGLGSGGTTFLQARTANEVLKAQTNKLRLARLKGELVDRAQAMAHVFKLARTERDAWLNWPARISAQLAAELGADPHTLHVMLEREVRKHLDELGHFQPRID